MTIVKTTFGRRSFLKSSALAGGGLMLGFSWFASCKPTPEQIIDMPKEWFDINAYLKIGDNGLVTIMSPNPEIGQNVKTSMPMIVAEELDVDWQNVIVEQARLNTDLFTRQLAGGSQSIRQGWESLRMAGASARRMLQQAAAESWKVPVDEITVINGVLSHDQSDNSAGFGEFASAAARIPVPEEVKLKDVEDYKIIGSSRKNVDGNKIVKGEPLYGIDFKKEGMLIAMLAHPPAFGMKLKSFDGGRAAAMPGVKAVIPVKTYHDDYKLQWSDRTTYVEQVAIVGNSTWEVMQAKKALEVEWETAADNKNIPQKLENSSEHKAFMLDKQDKKVKVKRKNGKPKAAFKKAAKIIERSYSCPFLAHNTMEPMNFFAHVTSEGAELAGPIQTPEFMEKAVASRLGLPLEKVDIQMTRIGGGFGRRLYGHFLVEAAVISQKMEAPIKLLYTREDDMTFGIYRPAYLATYRAALDENNNLTAIHVKAGGIPESPLFANRFPAGAIDNYLAESWTSESNISVGAFRAPRSNFIAGAEQSFLDELAEEMGKDPIDFRLELLEKAKKEPVGKKNDYEAERYAGVLKLVKEKSNWGGVQEGVHRGVSAYFCHNSYVAQVLDMVVENGTPVVKKVYCAIDCGIVVNPDAATNLAEGGIVDGIGHAMYSELTVKEGVPEQSNFDKYKLIRHSQAPKEIEVHFVKNDIDPTGLGEPPFPPIMGAVANALYKATGERFYDQPFMGRNSKILG